MHNKMITLDNESLRISQEVSNEYRRSASHKNGGFSWWVRRQLAIWDEGKDMVELELSITRNFNACMRLAGLIEELYAELYPNREPIHKELLVAQAINQRDLREWID